MVVEGKYKYRGGKKENKDSADVAKESSAAVRAEFRLTAGLLPFRLDLICSNIHDPVCMHLSCHIFYSINR